jgi:hypothetical protein
MSLRGALATKQSQPRGEIASPFRLAMTTLIIRDIADLCASSVSNTLHGRTVKSLKQLLFHSETKPNK